MNFLTTWIWLTAKSGRMMFELIKDIISYVFQTIGFGILAGIFIGSTYKTFRIFYDD